MLWFSITSAVASTKPLKNDSTLSANSETVGNWRTIRLIEDFRGLYGKLCSQD